jgi:hypothetical protein
MMGKMTLPLLCTGVPGVGLCAEERNGRGQMLDEKSKKKTRDCYCITGLGKERGTDRNRRVSSPLSPIFYLFLAPSGTLYQKVQPLLAEEERAEGSPPPAVIKHRRPGPKQPADSLPTGQWPTVVHRVVEQNEPLRKVAEAYGVSHETIRRLILHAQKPCGQQEA